MRRKKGEWQEVKKKTEKNHNKGKKDKKDQDTRGTEAKGEVEDEGEEILAPATAMNPKGTARRGDAVGPREHNK